LEKQEVAGFKVDWPLEPATSTVKAMAAEYERLHLNSAGLSKDELRQKLGRAKAIMKLAS
jgi:hypothetical protein